jgi:hypothetical protein
MKTLILLSFAVALAACNTPPTPAQVAGYSKDAQVVFKAGVQDAKTIKSLSK